MNNDEMEKDLKKARYNLNMDIINGLNKDDLKELKKMINLKIENIAKKDKRKIILFDFDGVIHDHSKSKWLGVDVIDGQLIEGMKELIIELRETFKIIIYSSRCLEEKGIKAIENWLDKEGIIVDGITNKKLSYASMIVDDRGINFDGSPSQLKKDIENFKPWYK